VAVSHSGKNSRHGISTTAPQVAVGAGSTKVDGAFVQAWICDLQRMGGGGAAGESKYSTMGLHNYNVEWLDGRGTWWFYLGTIGCGR